MRRTARRLTHWLSAKLRGQILLVNPMAGFMQRPHQRGAHIGLVITVGNPHITRRAAAKRMRRAVKPRMVIIQPGGLREPLAQRFLHRLRVGPKRHRGCRVGPLTSFSRRQGGLQKRRIVSENRRYISRAHAALKTGQQSIVWRNPQCRAQNFSRLPGQIHHLGQRPPHQREIGGLASGAPHALAMRISATDGLHQILRQRGGAFMRVLHQGKIGGVPGISWRGGGGKILRHLRRCEQFMRQPGQHRHLLTPRLGPAIGHHRRGIPAQHRRCLIQRGNAGEGGS